MPAAFRLNYIFPMSDRPRYHADDRSRDVLTLDPRAIDVEDGRLHSRAHSLNREGFALLAHCSAVKNFRDPAELNRVYRLEIERLLLDLTAADAVTLAAQPVCRSADTSRLTRRGKVYNCRPGDFVHIDISDTTAVAMAARRQPNDSDRRVKRFAHYNLWRVFSQPPQDVPLAVCDSRSVAASDLLEADAVMDIPGKKTASYVGLVVRYNPQHRWSYFSNMNRDELLVFKTFDSDVTQPNHVPHTAFTDPTCPAGMTPRASIEMRGIAYWYET